MEIIDVIQETTIMKEVWYVIIGLVSTGFFALITIICTNNIHKEISYGVFLCIDIVILWIILMLMLFGVFTVPGEETLVAQIEDNYPFSEIYNNYKIISKDQYSNIYYLVKLVK